MNSIAKEAIRNRAIRQETRTDQSKWGVPNLAAPASRELVESAELTLGFALWRDHRQVLMEIANGGFGPGDGLLGIPGGRLDDLGLSLIEMRKRLLSEAELARAIVPVCDWGCGIWSRVDCVTGEILTCDEMGTRRMGIEFGDWLEQWANGVNLWSKVFEYEESEVIDPATLRKTIIHRQKSAKGVPYDA